MHRFSMDAMFNQAVFVLASALSLSVSVAGSVEAASLVDGGIEGNGIVSGIDNLQFNDYLYDVRFVFDFNRDSATDFIGEGIVSDTAELVDFGQAIADTLGSLGYTGDQVESDTPTGSNFRTRGEFALFDNTTSSTKNPVFNIISLQNTGSKINGFTGIWVTAESIGQAPTATPEPASIFGIMVVATVLSSRILKRK